MSASSKSAFRSLKNSNYRLWAAGALVSNTGTWMQRVAQDWLILTRLTHHDARAVGVVTALQFAPQILFLPWTGSLADHMDRRKLLAATQLIMGALAFGLGVLTVTDLVRAWHVYLFAFLVGTVTAFDSPVRQTFVADLVGEVDLPNAVALNSASFNLARMVGPAIAGVLIAVMGSGWMFLLNGASFLAVLGSLGLMRAREFHAKDRVRRPRRSLGDGVRYIAQRSDLKALILMLFLIGAFGLNFPIFIATMSVSVFHLSAGGYGMLTSTMAVGSVAGALLAARREKPTILLLVAGAAVFGVGCLLAALMPNDVLFGLVLVGVGLSAQTLTTSTIGLVQMSTDPAMRGRVMAILLAVALGGQPLGAPLVGWIANAFGPRWAIGVAAVAGLLAALVTTRYLVRHRGLRLRIVAGRPQFGLDDDAGAGAPMA